MREFEEQVEIRNEQVEGIGPWYWIKGEEGVWKSPREHFPVYRDRILQLLGTERRDVIVQAGGALGLYPRLWAETFKYVYTFEPEHLNYHCLALNCQIPNIYKFQAVLANVGGIGHLHQRGYRNSGMHSLIKKGKETIPVVQIALDDLELEYCDVLQLDVESAEYIVLQGAKKTIQKYHPVISLETVEERTRVFLKEQGYIEHEKIHYETFFSWGG